MEKEKPKTVEAPPAPPAGITDPDQIAGGEERWQECPLKDCKRNPELLYADFYLRDIRTNRLMCNACAVRMEVGYIAREVAKAADDRFFSGTKMDYVIVFITALLLSLGVNTVLTYLNFWMLGIFIGFGAGALIGRVARNVTKGRVGRYSSHVAALGIIAGFFCAPPLLMSLYFYTMMMFAMPMGEMPFTGFLMLFSGTFLTHIICTGIMAVTVYGIFRRRI